MRLVDIPVSLDVAALMKAYSIEPGSDHARVFTELVAGVQAIARPKAVYEIAFIDAKGDDWISVGAVKLTSRALRKNLDAVERVFPYVATCGTEVDALDIPAGDICRKAWLYFLKGEILQIAVAHTRAHISRHFQIENLSSMNPGSGDACLWPLAEQEQLFSILKGAESEIGVRLTESMLLSPEISVSGVFFPTQKDFLSCQVCHRERCPSRMAPFDAGVWESLQGSDRSSAPPTAPPLAPPTVPDHKEFVSEPITPLDASFDLALMPAGEPGLPRRFRWRDTVYEVKRVSARWKTVGPCRNGSREQYVRKHWFRVETTGGEEMEIYFDRQPRSGRSKQRWWLATVRRATL